MERESLEMDVVFVGAGPANLSGALHLARLVKQHDELIAKGERQGRPLGELQIAVIEKGASNYSAYVSDLPGCVSTGRTIDEVKRNIQEAIELHIQGMVEDGDAVPQPTTVSDYIDTRVA